MILQLHSRTYAPYIITGPNWDHAHLGRFQCDLPSLLHRRGCAVDGAKRGLLEAFTHVHQLAVKASVFRTHRGGFAHKVVDSDLSDLVVLDPYRFLGCDVIDFSFLLIDVGKIFESIFFLTTTRFLKKFFWRSLSPFFKI